MREIRFRGRRVDNGEWVYGLPAYNRDCTGIDKIGEIMAAGEICRLVDPETVGQYTGLKDRNGKEIYEGDIIQFINSNMQEPILLGYMKWFPEKACWTCTALLNEGWYGLPYFEECDNEIHNSEDVEIIGNIHEHPHLLKGE